VIDFIRHNRPVWRFTAGTIKIKGDTDPMAWTVRPTRQQVRELREKERNWMRPDVEIVKVKLSMEVVLCKKGEMESIAGSKAVSDQAENKV